MIQRPTFSPFSKRSTSAPKVSIMFSPCLSMKFSSSSGVFTCWISCRRKESVIPNERRITKQALAWSVMGRLVAYLKKEKVDQGSSNLRWGFGQCLAFQDTTLSPLDRQNRPQPWSALYSALCPWPSRHGWPWIQQHNTVKTVCMPAVEVCVCVCSPLLTSQPGHSPGTLSASAHARPEWSDPTGPLCSCRWGRLTRCPATFQRRGNPGCRSTGYLGEHAGTAVENTKDKRVDIVQCESWACETTTAEGAESKHDIFSVTPVSFVVLLVIEDSSIQPHHSDCIPWCCLALLVLIVQYRLEQQHARHHTLEKPQL